MLGIKEELQGVVWKMKRGHLLSCVSDILSENPKKQLQEEYLLIASSSIS